MQSRPPASSPRTSVRSGHDDRWGAARWIRLCASAPLLPPFILPFLLTSLSAHFPRTCFRSSFFSCVCSALLCSALAPRPGQPGRRGGRDGVRGRVRHRDPRRRRGQDPEHRRRYQLHRSKQAGAVKHNRQKQTKKIHRARIEEQALSSHCCSVTNASAPPPFPTHIICRHVTAA